MNQCVLASGNLIEAGRCIPKFSFGADIIKIHRQKFGELLGEIEYRLNTAVEEAGHVPWEKIGILYKNTA